MAANNTYQDAMRAASSAAWDLNWQDAVQAYQRALTTANNDPQALTGLALAKMELGQHDEAMQIYHQLSELVPTDPLPYEKIAEIYEAKNRPQEASTAYLNVAEIYYSRKDMAHAVENWERALSLNSDLAKAHMRLALWYSQRKNTEKAVIHFVEVARLLQEFGKAKKAEETLNRALKLDATSILARNALDDLKRGRTITRTEPYSTPGSVAGKPPKRTEAVEEDEEFITDQEITRTPTEESARHAMALLADKIWDGSVPGKAQAPLMQAIDLHQAGDAEGAIEQYEAVMQAGVEHPALRFNAAVLYAYTGRHNEAIRTMQSLIQDETYALAGRISLGKIYLEEGDIQQAADHLLNALYLADHELNTQVDEVGYQRVLSSLSDKPTEDQREIADGILRYLDDPNWRKKLTDTFGGYAAQGIGSYINDLMELIVEGGRPVLAEIMQRIDYYMERNMLELASQEAHFAIEKSPDYLPAHRRIADVMVAAGHNKEAAEKINTVAETYMLRGNAEKAADLFAEVIEIWPADLEARQRVLQMLKAQSRADEALHHYIELSDLYRRMADTDQAQRTYEEALQYAQSNDVSSPKVVAILKALADLEAQRFNWRQALNYYEQIVPIAPDDEDTSLAIADLHFQLGDARSAIGVLDNYMRQCITRGQPDRIVTTLEEQVRKHPEQIPLRQRLAQVYQRQNRVSDAIVQLNEIGDTQIEAGNYEAAAKTIKKIVALNPPDVEQYQHLLTQLESSS
jgi:tetratricopeptide (TPR) repeat protein